MPLTLESPYPAGSQSFRWFKGNLHTHSTRSDGKLPPQEVLRRYADLGYDFLAMTDHDVASSYEGLDPCGLVLIQGNEVTGGAPHAVHIGALTALHVTRNHQQLIDDIAAHGGFVFLAHPNWEADFNHYPYEMLASLNGYLGVEIYNGGGVESEGSHLAVEKWDRLLSNGRKLWAFANDDSHTVPHIGRGWNMVAAAERSAEAIYDALVRGSFYASSGVTIERIETGGPMLHVMASNAQRIALIGKNGTQAAVSDGSELHADLSEVRDSFVRVECWGRPLQQAWSQPIYLRGGVYEQEQAQLATMNALQKSTLRALRSDTPPVITGELSDPLWAQAEMFSTFRHLRDGAPAPVKTHVSAILSDDTLYFGFRCEQPEATEASQERALWRTDSVEVFLDTEGRGMSCWHVGINAAGKVEAACRGANLCEPPKPSGKAGRYSRGAERGWSAELAIPLAGVKVSPGQRMGLHLCRNRPGSGAHYIWSWVGNSNHNREQYGSLIV